MVHQKVPKLYFQSQFSMSKINRIFSKETQAQAKYIGQKIRWPKPKPINEKLRLRPINRLICRPLNSPHYCKDGWSIQSQQICALKLVGTNVTYIVYASGIIKSGLWSFHLVSKKSAQFLFTDPSLSGQLAKQESMKFLN